MPLGLYMDVHIPRAVTNGLRRRGVDVITAQQDDAAALDDSKLGRLGFVAKVPFDAEVIACRPA